MADMCYVRTYLDETYSPIMECTAGKATPSPAPSRTRAAMAGPSPWAAAAGVRKVKRDQRRMPA